MLCTALPAAAAGSASPAVRVRTGRSNKSFNLATFAGGIRVHAQGAHERRAQESTWSLVHAVDDLEAAGSANEIFLSEGSVRDDSVGRQDE